MCLRWAGWIFVALMGGGAALADDAALQRQLAAERQAVDARFEREQSDCRQRFALNACIDEARARQRQALSSLRLQQREIDERRRTQRAADRQQAIERRQSAVDGRPAPASAPAARAPRAAASRPQATRDRAADRAAAQAKAAERAAAARKLQAEIQADQARILERQTRRAAKGKAAVPLPAPSAPSAPG